MHVVNVWLTAAPMAAPHWQYPEYQVISGYRPLSIALSVSAQQNLNPVRAFNPPVNLSVIAVVQSMSVPAEPGVRP
jgi:hypothetical protein